MEGKELANRKGGGMARNICTDRLERLLRYGRKNGGCWDDGECDCPPELHCNMLDDGDVYDIIEGLKLLDAERAKSAMPGHVCHTCDGTGIRED